MAIGGTNSFGGAGTGNVPGLTSPAPAAGASVGPDPNTLVLDPASGLYYDPKSQNYFQKGADGSFTTMTPPNQPSQIASFYGAGKKYAGEASPYEKNFNDIFGQQSALAGNLQNTINNPNASSVAREQLAQTLQANEGAQLSQAAGAGGGNAFMARRNAANNIAALNANAGRDAALVRANEVANATNSLGNVLGTQSGEASGMYTGKTGTGLDYNRLGAQTAAGDFANRLNNTKQDWENAKTVATGGGSALSAVASSDPRVKTDIHEEGSGAIDKFLSSIQPEAYQYKGDPEERDRHGVMTTDLKKSKIGRDMMREAPDGTEGYDRGDALAALFGALADMHRRVKKVEGRRG